MPHAESSPGVAVPQTLKLIERRLAAHRLKPTDTVYPRNLATRLDTYVSQLTPRTRKEFLRDPYVRDGIDGALRRKYDASYNPEHPDCPTVEDFLTFVPTAKVEHALTMRRLTREIAKRHQFEEQYAPMVATRCYVASEMIKNFGIPLRDSRSARSRIDHLLKSDDLLPQKRQLLTDVDRAIRNLQDRHVDFTATGVFDALATQTYQEIRKKSEERAVLRQSQGVEVEVLAPVDVSVPAIKRGVDVKKWLPRGIRKNLLKRTDWNILPLLGVPEDPGEKAYQTFEMSPEPTESGVAQTELIKTLIAGDFIIEDLLSDTKEYYSLHITTPFPTTIWNDISRRQYHGVSRVLSGAFASDQRIQYGGFAAGRDVSGFNLSGEIKSNPKGIKVIKKNPIGSDEAVQVSLPTPASEKSRVMITEIRTFDVNAHGHEQAINAKEPLDAGFRSYWLIRNQLDRNPSSLDRFTARRFKQFDADRRKLFSEVGITEELKTGWKELADAMTAHPDLRQKLQKLATRYTEPVLEEAKQYAEKISRIYDTVPRTLKAEPDASSPNRLYLPASLRKQYALPANTPVRISCGQLTEQGQTALSRFSLRPGKAQPESEIRVSGQFLTTVGIPDGWPVKLRVSDVSAEGKAGKEVRFGPVVGICTDVAFTPEKSSLLPGSARERIVKDHLRAARASGAFAYVFRPSDADVDNHQVRAYTLDANDKWIPVTTVLPDVLYSYGKMTKAKEALDDRLHRGGKSVPFIRSDELVRLLKA